MPLIQFQRTITRQFGEDDAVASTGVAINPAYVSAVLPNSEQPDHTVLRMSDGRGLVVQGAYSEVYAKLHAHAPGLLEFDRPDGESKVAIAPRYVSALFESQESPEVLIARLPDGRGINIRGHYDAVQELMLPFSSDEAADRSVPVAQQH
jgi:hypothetical protein